MVQEAYIDVDQHANCRLSNALHLIGGTDVHVSPRLFGTAARTKTTRLMQMGYSLYNLLRPPYRKTTLVSGESLAYQTGRVKYFTGNLLAPGCNLLLHRNLLFKLPGERPADVIAQLTGCDNTPDPELRLSGHCVVLIMANWQGAPTVLHYGRCQSARDEISRQAMGIALPATDRNVWKLVPHLISLAKLQDGATLAVETRLKGHTLPFDWGRIDRVGELWLSNSPSGSAVARPRLEQELNQVIALLPSHDAILCRAADALLAWHGSLRLPSSLAHGDLWLGNVLFEGDTVTGIVDWEWAHADGLRILDILHLLLMSYAVSRETGVAHQLCDLWEDQIDDQNLASRLRTLSRDAKIDGLDLKYLALLLWFDYLRQNTVRHLATTPEWVSGMLSRTAPSILKWLPKCNNSIAGSRPLRENTLAGQAH